jgi:hypothetical protein
MSTSRPFAYNPTLSLINGAIRVFNSTLTIGVDDQDYTLQPGGIQWWNGPDEDLGYVIAHSVPTGTQPNPLGISAYVGFWRSSVLNENSFVEKAGFVSSKTYTTGDEAYIWMNGFGYWSSWEVNPGSLIFPNSSNTARIIPTHIGTVNEFFTIEFWYFGNPVSTGSNQYIFSQSASFGGGDLNLYIDPSDSCLHGLSTGNAISLPLSTNVWQHIAITCDNGQVKVYFDGNDKTAVGIPNTLISNTIGLIYFGSLLSSSNFLDAKLTDIRICRNIVYTSGFTTPKSSLLPIQGANPYGGASTNQINDGDCVLLIDSLNSPSFQQDLSNLGSTVIVGAITRSSDTPY